MLKSEDKRWLWLFVSLTIIGWTACSQKLQYPQTKKIPVVNSYHGTDITDNYRWLEKGEDEEVNAWVEAQERLTHLLIDKLPHRQWLANRFNELRRYDDEDVPKAVIDGEKVFVYTKKENEDKWVYNVKDNPEAPLRVLIDPNEWEKTETLAYPVPSRDGRYVAYGVAHGGDENPIYRILVTETGEVLPDSLLGWKQYVTSWLPDHSGFYYSAKPFEGDVPEGEEYYWPAAYLHKLGTPASADKKVFWHDDVKEYWHTVRVSEDGKWEIFNRSLFNTNEIYIRPSGSIQPPIALTTGFDAQYSVDIIEDKILIRTDFEAPLYKVYVTDMKHPQRRYWQEFIPEHEQDKLERFEPIGGHFYAIYQHNAYTRVSIYNADGRQLRDMEFPTIGHAKLSGFWSKPDVWVEFESYTYPSTIFRYDLDQDSLILYYRYPVEIEFEQYVTEQIWYNSQDGTPISMFLVHRQDFEKTGVNPTLLTGYGGFNISENPSFSTTFVAWLEAGAMIALPNLRGGGEYGRAWHEAGMRDKKQNVFDDFIAAAEWLIENNYTNSEKLAIYGGSNGGLLVGAFAVQRPELCKAIYCAVPLLDMVNYHTFGLANIWSEEYGSSDDPEQFQYLHAYSPYHNVQDGVAYPAMLITGSENDARVDPLHARKMVAIMQEANPHGEPILLLQRRASGHHGGTTLSEKIEQHAEVWGFLMAQIGIKIP
jgi:prolyl oligopeptidase